MGIRLHSRVDAIVIEMSEDCSYFLSSYHFFSLIAIFLHILNHCLCESLKIVFLFPLHVSAIIENQHC